MGICYLKNLHSEPPPASDAMRCGKDVGTAANRSDRSVRFPQTEDRVHAQERRDPQRQGEGKRAEIDEKERERRYGRIRGKGAYYCCSYLRFQAH